MTKSVTLPQGYLTAASDVPWKASYLALEPPSAVHTLTEFGGADHHRPDGLHYRPGGRVAGARRRWASSRVDSSPV